jgi:hypothetical protein
MTDVPTKLSPSPSPDPNEEDFSDLDGYQDDDSVDPVSSFLQSGATSATGLLQRTLPTSSPAQQPSDKFKPLPKLTFPTYGIQIQFP